MTDDTLLDHARAGNVRALARVLTSIEDRTEAGRAAFASLYAESGNAWTTGVTGAPGAGKSSLVSQFVGRLRGVQRIAVVAVDPSSPFTGGAILGDRIRMADHAGDDRVYIRSLANRGALGGISDMTPPVVAALDGLGFEEIVVETVGVGQSEVEVATAADTTVVVVSPGWGDSIQVSKAGFLEIADVFVVNKADRPGAEGARRDLEAMLSMGPERPWTPPVVETNALDGRGVDRLVEAIAAHRHQLTSTDERRRRRRVAAARQVAAALRLDAENANRQGVEDVIERVSARDLDPWSAARALLGTE